MVRQSPQGGTAGMRRPWNIAEQVIEDPSTKLRLEFSSVHTDELAAGREAPGSDEIIYLRLWTSARDRVATYAFTRGGEFIKATVEPLQLVVPPGGFEDINYAKLFAGDI